VELSSGNAADEVLLALTHANPHALELEVQSSSYGWIPLPTATAILVANGYRFEVKITALKEDE
jgi:hypothetical protein